MAKLIINSIDAKLEALYKASVLEDPSCVLLLHPHPLHGGDMHSKVVFTMEKVFYNLGFSTLRFNFRGAGSSEGEYGDGISELVDASTCIDWLQNNNKASNSFWVAGFSFGAYIALQLTMRRIEINNFIALGIPTDLFDFSFIHPCPTNGLFIHADKDEIASIKEAEKVIKKVIKTKEAVLEYEVIKDSDHFFTKHLDTLVVVLENYIQKNLNP